MSQFIKIESWYREKFHIWPKVTMMGSIIGHRIDYNGVGALRASGTYPAKSNPSTFPGLNLE